MFRLKEGILGNKDQKPARKAYVSHRVIQLKKKMGQGGYAIVYQAMDEDTYKEYVLKRMDCKVRGVCWVRW